MKEIELARLHANIKGRVQGVGFRAFVVDKALGLGVKGWTRNRWDGSVEVMAEGERIVLDQFLLALRRGPAMSNVSQLDLEWSSATGEFKTFYVRSTS